MGPCILLQGFDRSAAERFRECFLRQPRTNLPEVRMPHQQFQSCIDACNSCATACDHCAAACLQENDVKHLVRCIQLDLDCAAVCRLAAGAMGRGSELAGMICDTCVKVCDACAEECERHSAMEHCRECAEACRRCADECRRMAGQLGGGRRAQSRAGAQA